MQPIEPTYVTFKPGLRQRVREMFMYGMEYFRLMGEVLCKPVPPPAPPGFTPWQPVPEFIQRELDARERAVLDERERCARIVEYHANTLIYDVVYKNDLRSLAKRIRSGA